MVWFPGLDFSDFFALGQQLQPLSQGRSLDAGELRAWDGVQG